MRSRILLVCWIIIVPSLGYACYVQLVAIQRIKAETAQMMARPALRLAPNGPAQPCRQGMTLQPGESCAMTITIPTRLAPRDDL